MTSSPALLQFRITWSLVQSLLFELSEPCCVSFLNCAAPCYINITTMLTIVIADSRGRHLDMWVDNEEILISFHPGARLIDVAREALHIVPRFSPDIILLMAGINDTTIMDRRTRQVRLISISRAVIIQHLICQINQAKHIITSAFPNVKVAIGGIIGLELNTYNRRSGISRWQYVIDDAITAINSYIRQLNQDSNLPHPRLTTKVHTWRRRIRRCIYSRLHDGLHPGDLILSSWARQLNRFHHLCEETTLAQQYKN